MNPFFLGRTTNGASRVCGMKIRGIFVPLDCPSDVRIILVEKITKINIQKHPFDLVLWLGRSLSSCCNKRLRLYYITVPTT